MPLVRNRQPMASIVSMIINIVVGRRRDRERVTSGESDVKKKNKIKKKYKERKSDHVCTRARSRRRVSARARCRDVRIRFQESDRNINEIVKVNISEESGWSITWHVFIIRPLSCILKAWERHDRSDGFAGEYRSHSAFVEACVTFIALSRYVSRPDRNPFSVKVIRMRMYTQLYARTHTHMYVRTRRKADSASLSSVHAYVCASARGLHDVCCSMATGEFLRNFPFFSFLDVERNRNPRSIKLMIKLMMNCKHVLRFKSHSFASRSRKI